MSYVPKLFIMVLLSAMVLAACAPVVPATPSEVVMPTSEPEEPVQTFPGEPAAPQEDPLAPQPGDEGKTRGEAFIHSAELYIMESYPIQVALYVQGDKPTPCNELRAVVQAPDEEMQIHVEIYTVRDPGMMCVQVLDPFDENIGIPMAGAADGSYTVWVNGELVGEFSYPGG